MFRGIYALPFPGLSAHRGALQFRLGHSMRSLIYGTSCKDGAGTVNIEGWVSSVLCPLPDNVRAAVVQGGNNKPHQAVSLVRCKRMN